MCNYSVVIPDYKGMILQNYKFIKKSYCLYFVLNCITISFILLKINSAFQNYPSSEFGFVSPSFVFTRNEHELELN